MLVTYGVDGEDPARPGTRSSFKLTAYRGVFGERSMADVADGSVIVFSTLASGAAPIAIVQTPGLSHFFGCQPLGPAGWGIAAGASTIATRGAVLASRATDRPECLLMATSEEQPASASA